MVTFHVATFDSRLVRALKHIAEDFDDEIRVWAPRTDGFSCLLQSDVIVIDLTIGEAHVNGFISETRKLKPKPMKQVVAISSLLTWANTSKETLARGPGSLIFGDRKPHLAYQWLHRLESKILLNVHSSNENEGGYKCTVLAAGVVYGRGEKELKDLFYFAQNGKPITYEREGSNVVPTVHVDDLALMIRWAAKQPKNHQAIGPLNSEPTPGRYFCVTEESSCTQAEIYQAIATALGIEATSSNTTSTIPAELYLDLKFKRQDLFETIQFRPSGFVEDVYNVHQDFLSVNKLRPCRVLVEGPPLSGKSYLCGVLSNRYDVDLINKESILEVGRAQENSEVLGLEKKGKAIPSALYARLVEDMLNKKLEEGKGFAMDILEFEDEKMAELLQYPQKNEEEQDNVQVKPRWKIDCLVIIVADEEQCSKNLERVPENEVKEGYNDAEGFASRWATHANHVKSEEPEKFLGLKTFKMPFGDLDTLLYSLENFGMKVKKHVKTPTVSEELTIEEGPRMYELTDEDKELIKKKSKEAENYLNLHVAPSLIHALKDIVRDKPQEVVKTLAEAIGRS